MNSLEDSYILAIEAAIAGGSLSLCRGEVEIASWSGPADVSKAEDLLFNIDVLLRENGVSKRDLGLLVVSAGPGSFTGIRIGIATALGLKTGLGIPMATVSSLAAMVAYPDLNGPVYAAVPSGRQAVCFQKISVEDGAVTELTEPQTIREADFLAHGFDEPVLVHGKLYEAGANRQFINVNDSIASYIAKYGFENPGMVTPPMFISKSF